MNKEASNNPSLTWQQRWLQPGIYWTQLAKRAPDRGLVSSNRSNITRPCCSSLPVAWLVGKLQFEQSVRGGNNAH